MTLVLPNVRKLFVPDPGYTIYEADLKGADAQVVAWEADDEDLKAAFRAGLDVHSKNAEDMWGTAFTQLTGHARYVKRQQNKVAIHATNYGANYRTIAKTLGWTNHEAERYQRRWFSIHPRIKTNFHGGVDRALQRDRTVWNRFGFRRVYFDRIENCFAEGLAWIPQSTVALNTFYGAFALEEKLPEVEILLQVHDSLVFQAKRELSVSELQQALSVTVPYDDELVIPWDIKLSKKSWGDVAEAA